VSHAAAFLLSLLWVHFLASPKSRPAICQVPVVDTAVETLLTVLWLVVIALVGYALTGVEKLPIDKVPAEPVTALALAIVLFIISVACVAGTVSQQKRESANGTLPVTAAVNAAYDGPKDMAVERR
jgi:membrane protein implicated in regulation of membrane protease activity